MLGLSRFSIFNSVIESSISKPDFFAKPFHCKLSTKILLKVIPFNEGIEEVMFTFQKEVADRITSQPNSKNYSRLSVIVQSVCDIKKKQNLPANIFYPIPKVSSTVLTFVKKKKFW